jgi:hypothetical protein
MRIRTNFSVILVVGLAATICMAEIAMEKPDRACAITRPRLSLRTMSNSQQGISNIQGKYTKIWSVGNSLLDIGYSVPRKI